MCSSPGIFASLSPLGTLLPRLQYASLVDLRVDGLEDLTPILSRTPNLESLHMVYSGGLRMSKVAQFLPNLKLVPKLRVFSISPEFVSFRPDEGIHTLMEAVGKALPQLEQFSLQTRWLGYGVSMVSLGVSRIEVRRYAGQKRKIHRR